MENTNKQYTQKDLSQKDYWKMKLYNFCYKHIISISMSVIALFVFLIYIVVFFNNLYADNLRYSVLLQKFNLNENNIEVLQEIVAENNTSSPYYKLAKSMLEKIEYASNHKKKKIELQNDNLFDRIVNIIHSDKKGMHAIQMNPVEAEAYYIKTGKIDPNQKNTQMTTRMKLALIGQEKEIDD